MINIFFKLIFPPSECILRKEEDVYSVHDVPMTEGEENLRLIYYKVVYYFETERMFLDPGLSLSDMAEMVGTNKNYVTKAVQGYSENEGFCEYMNKERVNYSKDLLLSGDLPLSQVAQKSGYNSASTFNLNFKKYEYLSPGEWRQIHSAASTALK